jgi:hypothetical protein
MNVIVIAWPACKGGSVVIPEGKLVGVGVEVSIKVTVGAMVAVAVGGGEVSVASDVAVLVSVGNRSVGVFTT